MEDWGFPPHSGMYCFISHFERDGFEYSNGIDGHSNAHHGRDRSYQRNQTTGKIECGGGPRGGYTCPDTL